MNESKVKNNNTNVCALSLLLNVCTFNHVCSCQAHVEAPQRCFLELRRLELRRLWGQVAWSSCWRTPSPINRHIQSVFSVQSWSRVRQTQSTNVLRQRDRESSPAVHVTVWNRGRSTSKMWASKMRSWAKLTHLAAERKGPAACHFHVSSRWLTSGCQKTSDSS